MSAARSTRQEAAQASQAQRAKRKRHAAARRHRKALAARREEIAAQIEALVAELDALDGDPDFEDEPEFAGTDLACLAALGVGDATDAECNGDPEPEPTELDLADDEPGGNYPVSETLLGRAAWRPESLPVEIGSANLPTLPAPPEGYVAIRVWPDRVVGR